MSVSSLRKRGRLSVEVCNVPVVKTILAQSKIEASKNFLDICTFSVITKERQMRNTRLNYYQLVNRGRLQATNAQQWTQFLLHKKHETHLEEIHCLNDKIHHVIKNRNSNTIKSHVINAWSPKNGTHQQLWELLFTHLQNALNAIPPQHTIIIMGDLNSKIENNSRYIKKIFKKTKQ